jgi:hypothetical protein
MLRVSVLEAAVPLDQAMAQWQNGSKCNKQSQIRGEFSNSRQLIKSNENVVVFNEVNLLKLRSP